MNKEIIGYKLLKDLPDVLAGTVSDAMYTNQVYFPSIENSENNHVFSLSLIKSKPDWFEPVYFTPEFKTGDWIISDDCKEPKADLIIDVTDEYYVTKSTLIDNKVLGFSVNRTDLRLATEGEIFKSLQETYKVGDYVIVLEDVTFNNPGINLNLDKNEVFKIGKLELSNKHTDIWLIPENKGSGVISKYCRLATKEEIQKFYKQSKTLTLGDRKIIVTVSKKGIEAESKSVSIESIHRLLKAFEDKELVGIPWTVGFIGSIRIGCSIFTKRDLELIVEAYEEINN